MLEGIGRQHLPVYLELAPETQTIERLLIPYVTQIIGLKRGAGGALEVEIAMSHARHLLTADQPDFAALEKGLRSALDSGDRVILTEDDDHRIIDVRPFEPPSGAVLPPLPPEPTPPAPKQPGWLELTWKKLWYLPWWPWWWFGCVSAAKAQQVFDAMSARSCDPLTVPPPCIPFLYPDDGCWGRAHEMCRLMIDMGLSPKKVWIHGPNLHPDQPGLGDLPAEATGAGGTDRPATLCRLSVSRRLRTPQQGAAGEASRRAAVPRA